MLNTLYVIHSHGSEMNRRDGRERREGGERRERRREEREKEAYNLPYHTTHPYKRER